MTTRAAARPIAILAAALCSMHPCAAQSAGAGYESRGAVVAAGGASLRGGGYGAWTVAGGWGSASSEGYGGYATRSVFLFASPSLGTLRITAPTDGSIVEGVVTLAASMVNGPGMAKLEFYVDGALEGVAAANPYAYPWDATAAANGPHFVTAKAYDAAGGLLQSATIAVSVSSAAAGGPYGTGPPRFGEVFAYPNPATHGNATIHIDSVGLESVRIRIYTLTGRLIRQTELNGRPGIGVNGREGYDYLWNLGGIAAGGYFYVVEAAGDGQTYRVGRKIAVR